MINLSPSYVFLIVLCFSLFEMTLSYVTSSDDVHIYTPQSTGVVKEPLKAAHDAISLQTTLASPPFCLHETAARPSLPDLRSQIIYYGSLCRPDAGTKNAFVCLMLKGEQEPLYMKASEPFFLKYDNDKSQWKRVSESPLQVTLSPKDKVLDVSITLSLSHGQCIKEPAHLASFTLGEIVRPPTKNFQTWTLEDDEEVDSSLFEKQHARWCGQDVVYEILSHDEMKKDCQRVLFQGKDGDYTIWVSPGKGCIFIDGKWTEVELGEASFGHTLLYTKAVMDSSIQFEVWNPDGSRMVPLLLSKQAPSAEVKLPAIQLIGARSKDTWIATIDGNRTLIKTDDWFLVSDGKVEKIQDEATLQEYVKGRKEGALLAFSGIERIGNEQCLVGISIDPSRTKSEPLSIPLYHSFAKTETAAVARSSNHHNGRDHNRSGHRDHYYDDDDDDDDYYDDDDDDKEIIEEEDITYED